MLDGIRGLAILLVLACHCTLFGGLQSSTTVMRLARVVTGAGWSGVDLFFVLSGFLITGILYDQNGSAFFFRNFYIRRVLRIFPLYYAVLALFFVVIPGTVSSSPAYAALVRDQGWYWSYLANVRITMTGWPEHISLGHFWSLAVEEQFYLIWPLVVSMTGRKALIRVCVCCIVGALGLRVGAWWVGNGLAAYMLTPARMDALAFGGLIAVLARSPGGLHVWRRHAGCLLTVSGGLLVAMLLVRRRLVPEDALMYTVGFSGLAAFFGSLLILVVTATPGCVLNRVFVSTPLRLMGRYSYGLYVFHVPIMGLLRRDGVTTAHLSPILGSELAGYVAYVAIAAGSTFLLAVVSWHFFENRVLMLKDRFRYAPSQQASGGGFARAGQTGAAGATGHTGAV